MTQKNKQTGTICYLSGTGNTCLVSQWMKDKMSAHGIEARAVAIEQAEPQNIKPADGGILGIGMPTHGFTIPWIMLKFLLKMPHSKGTEAFVFATRAGAKYGPIPGYPPGIAGSSIFIAALVLAMKGYRIRGIMSINMPSNWMSLHSGLRADIVKTIVDAAKPRAEAFIAEILAGRRVLMNRNILWELFWGIGLSWISAAYLLIGRFFLAKLFFANENCNGCGICADHCPTGSISMIGTKNPRPYWSLTCESCMRCMGFCPHNAIEAGHSWGAVLYYVTMEVPAAVYGMHIMLSFWPGLRVVSLPLQWLVFLAYYFLCLVIGYRVFWFLIKIPLVNRFFTYTTLTHIYRRYRAPGISLKNYRE